MILVPWRSDPAVAPDGFVLASDEVEACLATIGHRHPGAMLAIAMPAGQSAPPPLALCGTRAVLVLLEGACGRPDVERAGARLAVAEALEGRPDGSTGIAPIVSTAEGVLGLRSLVGTVASRLRAIAFDRGELAADLRCGSGADVLDRAESEVLLVAAACRVPAIALHDVTQGSDVARNVEVAHRRGFAGAVFRQAAGAGTTVA